MHAGEVVEQESSHSSGGRGAQTVEKEQDDFEDFAAGFASSPSMVGGSVDQTNIEPDMDMDGFAAAWASPAESQDKDAEESRPEITELAIWDPVALSARRLVASNEEGDKWIELN